MMITVPFIRLRRLRQHPVLRELIRETDVQVNDLIAPVFVKGSEGNKQAIASMPGCYQIPLNCLLEEIEEIQALGISSVILFGVPPYKDLYGSNAYHEHGVIQQAIRIIKNASSKLLVISDICCCEYTNHGHCGFIRENNSTFVIDNDKTLELLMKQAISHAQAGADVIAPSGMMDGMVKSIRYGLDSAGFEEIPILSYSVKYDSCLYGPFRSAAEGAPVFGDRSTHFMDPANSREALREAQLDIDEGVDMLMVKPAHSYLDVIYRLKESFPSIPLGAYHTSGEFCMIKAAAEKGWIDEKKAVFEILRGMRRAGADFIITYYAKEFAKWLALT
ncbi:MAG: porphobilinogen synthase [Rhabdochlamydiaceae bacterium]|jgi:porphobilinogen synthase